MKRTLACVITFSGSEREIFQGYRNGYGLRQPEVSIAMQTLREGTGSLSMRSRALEKADLENLCFASEHRCDHKLLRSGEEQGICQDL